MTQRIYDRISPEPNSGCWLWTGAVNDRGYGLYGKPSRYAHRIVYEIERGKIPDGLCALHRCDNPTCVNPDHIFIGTRADNIRDMFAKGRDGTTGEKSFWAKLVTADIIAIRASKDSLSTLAKKYGIGFSAVGKIKRRESWRHVGG